MPVQIGQIVRKREAAGPSLKELLIAKLAGPGVGQSRATKAYVIPKLRGDKLGLSLPGLILTNPEAPDANTLPHEDVHQTLKGVENLADIIQPPEALVSSIREKFQDPYMDEGMLGRLATFLFPKASKRRVAEEALAYSLTEPPPRNSLPGQEEFVTSSLQALADSGFDISVLRKIAGRQKFR